MKRIIKKLGAVIMSAAMALTFTPSAALAAGEGTGVETVPVYGLYNPNSGEHYFTINASETKNLLQIGWQEGDVKWSAPKTGDPVYCLYNPNVFDAVGNGIGDHHYTASLSERNNLLAAGWKQGDIAFYSASNTSSGSVPIYGLYNPNAYAMSMSGAHHLTFNKNEVNTLLALGWEEGNPKFYGYSNSTPVTEGKVLNIQVWNEEFKYLMENYYPGYIKTSDRTGKIGDVDVRFTITPTKDYAYQNNLDKLLPNNAKADANDKVDIFLIEADYALKYVDADANVAMKLSDLGITSSDLSDQYKFTQQIVTDKNGDIRGSSWDAFAGGLIYNRAIAKAVLGSDDPSEVQKAVSSWSKYNETAAKMKAAGYLMTATTDDTYRVYANNVSVPWVKGNKVTIDANIKKWADDSKDQVDARQTGTSYMWGDEWYAGFKAPGEVFCYFGPDWLFNYCMGNAPGSDRGDDGSIAYRGGWGFCEGPQGYYWGGTWVCAANGTDDPTLVKNVIKTMTTNKAVLKDIAIKETESTNSQSVLKELGSSAIGNNKILGGQNPYSIIAANAGKIDMSKTTPYDQSLDEAFQEAMNFYYFTGVASYDEAVQKFQQAAKAKYPNLTF